MLRIDFVQHWCNSKTHENVSFNVGLLSAADAVAKALKIIGGFDDIQQVKQAAAQGKPLPDLTDLQTAAKFYRERHRQITLRRVSDAVDELLKSREAQGASAR